jgi:hypothetical protein
METSLHRQLKARYGPDRGGSSEVVVAGFRIDAIENDGTLVEAQSGALGPLRRKLARLLPEYKVRVVKPVVVARRIVRRAARDGPVLSARFSPKRGDVSDVFDDLVGLARVFPHTHLTIDVLAVEIDEVRIPRRRWPGYRVADRILREMVSTHRLASPSDLWSLIPAVLPSEPFTTRDLAEAMKKPLPFAQRVAYCLRLSNAARVVGKRGNNRLYVRERGVKAGARRKAVRSAV